MDFGKFLSSKSRVSRVIFALVILYAALSIGCALTAAGVLAIPVDDLNYVMIGYSMISFVLAIFISAYHLGTRIQRRKRVTDKA